MNVSKIGKSLRRVRQERNETLYDMAKNLGIRTSELSGAEFGKNELSASALSVLKQEYQITIAYTELPGITKHGLTPIDREGMCGDPDCVGCDPMPLIDN